MSQEAPGSSPVHNQFLATDEQLNRYEEQWQYFAAAANPLADRVDEMRRAAGLDQYGCNDIRYDDTFDRMHFLLKNGMHNAGQFVEGVPELLGIGSDKWVGVITGPDGTQYALKGIRLSDSVVGDPEEALDLKLRRTVAPLIQGAGDQQLEQVLAVNKERRLIVTTLARGRLIHEIPTRELMFALRPRHVQQIARTRRYMNEHGLHHHNHDGVFFDVEAGIQLVDYTLEAAGDLNLGSTRSTRELLRYILYDRFDHDYVVHMRLARDLGYETPDAIKGTGLRAKYAAVVMRWADTADAALQNQ